MRTYDLSPLLRTSIGFDRTFDRLISQNSSDTAGYPPYNIERLSENDYRVTLAVAGFSEQDLDIEIHQNMLTIVGRKPEVETEGEFTYQGIAGRAFTRRFYVADHVRSTGATLKNGLLTIELHQEVPEELKPRKVTINGAETDLKIVKGSSAA